MCTVAISVQPHRRWGLVGLAVRDEFLDRAWDPFGPWWPQLGNRVVGLRDREAGGAWFATNTATSATAVVLNRTEPLAEPATGWTSRGALPLAAVAHGQEAPPRPTSRAFNLLHAASGQARWTGWDGQAVDTRILEPGVHMLTASAPDDPEVARVARWLPVLRDGAPSGPPGTGSWQPWLDILRSSAALPADDDEAIVRRHEINGRLHGSHVVCAFALGQGEVRLAYARLPVPGRLPETIDWEQVR